MTAYKNGEHSQSEHRLRARDTRLSVVGIFGTRASLVCCLAPVSFAHAQDSLAGAPRARAALNMPTFHWRFERTPNADIYILAGSAAEARRAWIRDAVERDIRTDLDWIHQRSLGSRLRLFFVGTRDQMKTLTDTPYGGRPFMRKIRANRVRSRSELRQTCAPACAPNEKRPDDTIGAFLSTH